MSSKEYPNKKQPNIILIMADHFRPDAIGPHTPNLNRLAAEGVRFTRAYSAAPLCQPARCSIITGMYPSQHGVCGNQSPPIREEDMEPPLGAPDTAHVRRLRKIYFEKIRLIDDYLGKLDELLTEKDWKKDTVILFTSDHGENLGNFGIWDKRYMYEHSCGVPLMMTGGGIRSGERMNGPLLSKALVGHLDIYPTILELAGITQPPVRERAGRSLLSMIDGVPGSLHDAVYAELATLAMIRTAGWKLVFDPEQGGVRYLFYLHVDPEELHNLAGVAGYGEITLQLVQRLLSHRIRLTQFSHAKEEQRLQSVRTE